VGKGDDAVLEATPPSLRSHDPFTSAARSMRFSPRYSAPATPRFAYPANGAPPKGFVPTTLLDLLPADAIAEMHDWFRCHWPYIADCIRRGSLAERGRIASLVIPQSRWLPAARGVVWDLRRLHEGIIVPADFDAPISSHLNLAFLASSLADYPDQELVGFLSHGTASKSSACGLDIVLGPHLTSLRLGFTEVDSSVSALLDRGWYDIFQHLPFLPLRILPQGVAAKHDGSLRRTTDAGSPRDATNPPTLSVNEAARLSHWIPEVKPTLCDLTRDVAILRDAAVVWNEPVYVLSHDFKQFFNQLRTHPSEWFKSCFFWQSSGSPAWVTEYVLGFGASPSSNIAQRFSHAILWLLAQRFDAEETALFAAESSPARLAYMAERARLGIGEFRLWSGHVFTDDPVWAIVGGPRTARLLSLWGDLTSSIGALMAGDPKRQLGCCVRWNGAFINAFLGNVVVPPNKVLRAVGILSTLAAGSSVLWRDYRSLVGLLEHIRHAVHVRRLRMYGLYVPHRLRGGHLALEPEAPIKPSPHLSERAASWIDALLHRPGAWCSESFPRVTFSASPACATDLGRSFFCYTDAAP
jgi:hypothetical protein